MPVLQERVTKKEINGTRKKTVKNMEECAYNAAYYKWLCVRMKLRIIQ
jgi:hypothetical protein